MRVFRDLDQLTTPLPNAVVTIGNFDGVHLGHREIFRLVVDRARAMGGASVVYTFVPHPLKVLAPERAPRLINTLEEKERLIGASCIDVLVCAPFTREVAALTADQFVEDVLLRKLGVRHLIVGSDYAFGRGREGDVDFLRRAGKRHGFAVEALAPIARSGEALSSTRIREIIAAGDVAGVVGPLGRHFTLEGEVVHGARRGKGLGFPTANLRTDKELLPCPGVYAVKLKRGTQVLDGVVNIGYNPTFGAGEMSIEVHIFDFGAEIYGEKLRIYFMERLRDERRFLSPEDLVAAIGEDVRRARNILARARIVEFREYLDCGVESPPL
ncbi:MAG: riboflavin biosynthesis protein RibF [Desulfuromonas sp.]|uniref:bifunctional riboflavin kinase/FAD synthetase n=1 Tax=Desulfuromonas sp. TaxID=892 RepID=UPI000CA74D9E|nr:bifunctional riboflavin kinase/FAD synthetase [Desulfuromonas sp.]PLX85719.1 MAG: riboflavin biosynthesis protein RibF [Desulfuromonas sp.]